MKQGAKYLGGALLAAVLLWWVFHGIGWADLRAALGRASMGGLLLAGAVNLGHNVFRVARWGLLLRPVRPQIAFRSRFSAVIIGYLTTWTIPGRLGEVVRPALLAAREKLPFGPCLGSVVADRLLDGAAILVLFAVGMFLAPLDAGASVGVARIQASSIAFVIFIVAALAILLVAGAARQGIASWLDGRTSKFVRGSGRMLLSLTEGTEALRKPRLLAPILAHSFLAWITIAFGTWLGVHAAGAQVPFSAVLLLLPLLALGVAVPTPGGAGGYHLAMKEGLKLFRVPEAVAVSAGILMHFMVTLPVIVLGVVLLRIEGISWRDLRGLVRRTDTLKTDPSVGEPAAEVVR